MYMRTGPLYHVLKMVSCSSVSASVSSATTEPSASSIFPSLEDYISTSVMLQYNKR